MLARIRIRDLGVIDDVSVDLSPGLNVLTGETGAGKTMVVTGLGLLLGARGDAGVVRSGAESCVVEGIVEVDDTHPARTRVLEAGGDAGDGEDLVLARSVSSAGRSRAYVGGRAAPVGVLGDVGEMLVAVHGQADQWRLRQPEQHREMLDDFGGAPLAAALTEYRRWYARLGELSAELARVRQLERDRMLESQVLVAGLEEIEAVAPLPGEDEALREEDERLGHADTLRMAAGAAHDLLTGADDASGGSEAGSVMQAIARVRAELSSAAGHDPALAALEPRVAEVGYLVAELGSDLGAYLTDLESDPARLEWVQGRRAELARLTRKFGDTCDDVLAWGARAAARLAELDGATARLEEIEAETLQARQDAGAAADRLHSERLRAADELGAAVTTELAHLAMGRAVVDVEVSTSADVDGLIVPALGDTPVAFGPTGVDSVQIRLAANPGAPARSVAKAASGGELSRVMLALEVVTGRPRGDAGGVDTTSPEWAVTTFVFDEVDAGVGGRAAVDVGARLAALAEHAQVVVVTHLAQVAAFADRHLVVRKADDGHVTSSGVEPVEGDARLAELARMMAGSASETALQHAAELREQALGIRGSLA
ncbi:MAG: DNA repair protein RecN [Dermatophilus congolensis]|nr:DNA repair protein RecN [Dermatophilus congolensis]